MRKVMILALLVLLVAACSPSGQSAATVQTSSTANTAPPPAENTTADTAAQPAENTGTNTDTVAAAEAPPAWLSLPLVNVNTGETFTLGGFAGKTVYVHPMARWCTNCRNSQRRLRDEVLPAVNQDDVVFISFTIETNDTADNLKQYAADESFNWIFAVATPDLVNALVEYYGFAVNTPPTQPHFLIRPDGTPTSLMTGNPSAAETLALLTEINTTVAQ